MTLMGLPLDAAFWATVALVLFVALILYLKVPAMIGKQLDTRIAKIEDELSAAKKLRQEAQALMAQYEAKHKAAEADAANIVAAAKDEAKRLTEEAGVALKELVARRTKAVEEKIAQAEGQALAEVRARSADLAVEAARLILADQMPEKGSALVERAIRDVAAKLN